MENYFNDMFCQIGIKTVVLADYFGGLINVLVSNPFLLQPIILIQNNQIAYPK